MSSKRVIATGWGVALPLVLLAGCGDVQVAAESEVPTPLIDPLPLTVGIYYSEDFSKYAHAEERWGVDWKAELGPYHVRMADRLFAASFREIVPVKDLATLPDNPPYVAIIQPRIEQYSFITPKDTGASYYAVTIKYRLDVLAPNGVPADSLTFTGYGSFKSGGMTSTAPMVLATKAAMRDAAAKFLVQFPEQQVAHKLLAGTPLIAAAPPPAVAGAAQPAAVADDAVIEMVPIVDTSARPVSTAATQPASVPPSTSGPTPEPTPESTPEPTTEQMPEQAPPPESQGQG